MAHTKTPWFITRSGLGVHHYIEARIRPGVVQEIASCGPTDGNEGSEGNAEFIVRACNAHYDLVEALKMVQSSAQEDSGQLCHDDLEVIRAAILKATGEQSCSMA